MLTKTNIMDSRGSGLSSPPNAREEAGKEQGARHMIRLPKLKSVLDLMSEFNRVVNQRDSANYLRIFMAVAEMPGREVGEIADRLDVPNDLVSTLSTRLGKGRRQEPGVGLLEKRDDPDDARVRRLYLTKRGQELADRMYALL